MAAAVKLAAVAAALAFASAVVLIAAPAGAVGPYPTLGSCQVFPDPPASLPAGAPSLADEAAWNQDSSKAPRDPRSAAYIAYIDSHGGDHLHPDFGSPRPYGFPYAVVGAGQRKLPVRYTAYGDESDPGPFPIPGKAPVEGDEVRSFDLSVVHERFPLSPLVGPLIKVGAFGAQGQAAKAGRARAFGACGARRRRPH